MGKKIHVRDMYYKGENLPHRQCTYCREWFPFSYYYPDKTSSLGIRCRCKSCENKVTVAIRQKKTGIVGRRYPKVARKVFNKKTKKTEMQRKCSDCKTWKPFNIFHTNSKDKWGISSICKECMNSRRTTNYHKYKETGHDSYWRLRVRRVNDLCKGRWKTAGQLDFEEVRDKFTGECYYCGDSIEAKDAHIDHVEPLSKGGDNVLSNIEFSCKTCNMLKYNLNPKELVTHMKKIIKHLGNTEITEKTKKSSVS